MLIQFSEFWLRELANPFCNSKNLAEQFNMLGLEVEDVKPVSLPFRGVLIGKIIKIIVHPKIINLKIFTIDIGKKTINVVSNETNLKKGKKLVVAPSGSILPENIKIKVKKFYNIISEGIFCSFSTLMIDKKLTSIIELPKSAPTGYDFYKYYKMDDNVFKVHVTPNRSDCLSILGIARDIAAINKINLSIPKISKIKTKIFDTIPIKTNCNLKFIYLTRIIKNIDIKKSLSFCIIEKLRRSGIKNNNTITDIAKYILLEFGQPINFFDLDCVDDYLNIRMAKNNEIFCLSNKKIKLNTDTLVVADKNKILSIAGVEGSNTHISHNTVNIIIESAFFHPKSIIEQIHKYKLFNDVSYRYERGIDYEIQYKAIERATNLVLKNYGGSPGPITYNNFNYIKKLSKKIFLRKKKLDNIIGYKISDNPVDILKNFGFKISIRNKIGWMIKIPSWRFDINIEEDLIEEIIRIYGYNNIKFKSYLTLNKNNNTHLHKVKTILANKGYQEIITYSFVDPKVQLLFHPKEKTLNIINPISKEMSVMRLSMLSGLTSIALYNQNRNKNKICLFESGICFIPDEKEQFGVRQELILSALLSGNRYDDHWDLSKKFVDFFDIKGDLEFILDVGNKIKEIEFRIENSTSMLHPGQSATIYLNNIKVGIIGAIHPIIEKKLCFKSKVFIFEIYWNKIFNKNNDFIKIKNISKYPINYRDISFFVYKNISVQLIINECKKFFKDNNLDLCDVNIFDIYQNIDFKKYKSISLRFTMQHINKTFKELEISDILTKCINKISNIFNIIIRDK